MKRRITVLMLAGWVLAGCSDNEQPPAPASAIAPQPIAKPVQVQRQTDFDQVRRGAQLYQQSCAECHGQQGEGASNWRQRNAEGKFPPPPLNGTGHAWHHPMTALKHTIRNGTAKLGGSMPAWKDKLSEQEMDDIIAWFQSKWPDEIYNAWYQNDQRARKRQ